MKILTIIGSPKGKGTGYKVAKKVEDVLKENGNIDVEYILLKDFNLDTCKGCFLCVKKGIETCPIDDDFNMLEKKIEKAEGIILVSPGYVYNVSWLMKNFIDRFAFTNHRPRYFDKKLMLIANAGSGMKETLKAMRNTLGIGPEIVSEISYISPSWELKDHVNLKLERHIVNETNKFYYSLIKNEKPIPSLEKYVRFKLFKKVSVEVKKYYPADFEYYKDKGEYYYETDISIFKKIIGSILLKYINYNMKDLEPKEV